MTFIESNKTFFFQRWEPDFKGIEILVVWGVNGDTLTLSNKIQSNWENSRKKIVSLLVPQINSGLKLLFTSHCITSNHGDIYLHVQIMSSHPAFTCSKSTMKTPEQCVKSAKFWRRSDVFIVNFEHISYLVLVCVFC